MRQMTAKGQISETKLQLHLTKVTNRVLAANVTASHSVWYVGVT